MDIIFILIISILITGVVFYPKIVSKFPRLAVASSRKGLSMADYQFLKCGIRGMKFRKFHGKLQEGYFGGYIVSEPTNQIDPDAIAICNMQGLHLGYIASWKTRELRDIVKHNIDTAIPCFGEVHKELEADGKLEWKGIIFIPVDLPEKYLAPMYDIFVAHPNLFYELDYF